jgi:acetyl-CoA carboxylase carboxyltransferase component
MTTLNEKLARIEADRAERVLGGGTDEIEKQHNKNRLTARERIDLLLDQNTFQELDLWFDAYRTGFDIDNETSPGDGVVVGWGEVNGYPVYVWAQDATVLDGTMAEVHFRKIVTVMERALRERIPIIGIYDSMGIRIQNAIKQHSHYSFGSMMRFQTLSSGVIPQVSLVMGPCSGGAALSAALADFVFMVRDTSYMHVAAVPPGTTSEKTGDPKTHFQMAGTCDVLASNDEECIQKCRELLGYVPANNTLTPPVSDTNDPPDRIEEELMEIVPVDTSKFFDMRKVIEKVVDNGTYFEIKKMYATNLSVGFARFNGQAVGIIANNSMSKGGTMDVDSSDKHARFTRFCDAFNIPLIYFADTPGFLPSAEQEKRGILRHGTMVIHATSEVTVPQITVFVRKCFGGAQLAMPTEWLQADRGIAWPSVSRGVMGAPGLMSILWRKKIQSAATPEEADRLRKEGIEVMEKTVERYTRISNDDFIDPRRTRSYLIQALKCTENKQQERPWRKHENMNL